VFLKYNIPTLLWATVILFLTLLPAASMPQVPVWKLISFHTAAHAAVFSLLAVLMLWGFKKQRHYFFLQQNAGRFTFLLSFLFGVLIEWLQSTLAWGRQGDVFDILSDVIGTVAGIIFYNLLSRQPAFKNYL